MPKKQERAGFLTSAQAAVALGLTKGTLHYWIKQGKIPPPESDPENGYYRWTLTDVELIRQTLLEEK
jgi:DNA-binding transcriptional MerR regulator